MTAPLYPHFHIYEIASRYLQRGAAGCTSSRRLQRLRTLGRLVSEVGGRLTMPSPSPQPSRVRALQAKGTIHSGVGGGGVPKKSRAGGKSGPPPQMFLHKNYTNFLSSLKR